MGDLWSRRPSRPAAAWWSPCRPSTMPAMTSGPITLCVDIGGSSIKAIACDRGGVPLRQRVVHDTPADSTPQRMLPVLIELAQAAGPFERVSVGFPGVVRHGVTYGAVNLQGGWEEYPLADELSGVLGVPVRVANDADVQGLGAVRGTGVELVLTLGTGLGSALFLDGRLVPNLELGHLPYRTGRTFEQEIGDAALRAIGVDAWRARVLAVLATFAHAFNHDRLYLGGGNARHLVRVPGFALPENAICVRNEAGLTGGVALWEGIPAGREVPRF